MAQHLNAPAAFAEAPGSFSSSHRQLMTICNPSSRRPRPNRELTTCGSQTPNPHKVITVNKIKGSPLERGDLHVSLLIHGTCVLFQVFSQSLSSINTTPGYLF